MTGEQAVSEVDRCLRQAAERRLRAIEINDNVLQGLIVAKWALDAGDTALAHESLRASVDAVRNRIQTLFEEERSTQASPRSELASWSNGAGSS